MLLPAAGAAWTGDVQGSPETHGCSHPSSEDHRARATRASAHSSLSTGQAAPPRGTVAYAPSLLWGAQSPLEATPPVPGAATSKGGSGGDAGSPPVPSHEPGRLRGAK